ncbi:general stress protein [Domibacillus robiginosus]|uniref:general stress protein n=1 Tax=Domibacillus robiginosus TaxID=1071054 RepID=UPI00067CC913|nr:general stress protein [Domibacillus robiginosus]
MYTAKIVRNHTEAASIVTAFSQDGLSKENIYVFAYDKKESKQLTDATNSGEIGLKEQGLSGTVSNVFKKRGDELRAKLHSLGLGESEAAEYEEQLDRGLIVVVATDQHTEQRSTADSNDDSAL